MQTLQTHNFTTKHDLPSTYLAHQEPAKHQSKDCYYAETDRGEEEEEDWQVKVQCHTCQV